MNTKKMVACHPFLKVIDQLVTPYPQDDFAMVMDQRLLHENPWDLNCHI